MTFFPFIRLKDNVVNWPCNIKFKKVHESYTLKTH